MKHGFDFYFGLPHSNDMNRVAGGPKGGDNSLDPDPKSWERAALRRREAHRAADRPDAAHAALRGEGGGVHQEAQGPSRAIRSSSTSRPPSRTRRSSRRRSSRTRPRADATAMSSRNSTGPWARSSTRCAARGSTRTRSSSSRATTARGSSAASPAAAPVCCATARAARGKAGCACRASRGGREKSPRESLPRSRDLDGFAADHREVRR